MNLWPLRCQRSVLPLNYMPHKNQCLIQFFFFKKVYIKEYTNIFNIFMKIIFWACSSVVERYVDIVEAISSILITPTKNNNHSNNLPFTCHLKNTIKLCLVIIAKGPHPIPFRTRKLSPSAPMVLCLKTWKSRTLPG